MEREECYNLYDREIEFLEVIKTHRFRYDPLLNDIFYGSAGEESGIRVGSILSCATPFLLITNIPKKIGAKDKRNLDKGTSKLRKIAEEFEAN